MPGGLNRHDAEITTPLQARRSRIPACNMRRRHNPFTSSDDAISSPSAELSIIRRTEFQMFPVIDLE